MVKFWLVLVIVGAAFFLWFGSIAVGKIWSYMRLNQTAFATISQWEIKQKSPSQFSIEASFTFEDQNKIYSGKTEFDKPFFLNIPSAESAIKKIHNNPWKVWYKASDPTVCSLQRNFPFKACIHAILTLAVVVYFALLKRFLLRIAI